MSYLNGTLEKYPSENEKGLFKSECGSFYEFTNDECKSLVFMAKNEETVSFDITKSPIGRPMRALIVDGKINRIFKRSGITSKYYVGQYCNGKFIAIERNLNPESEVNAESRGLFKNKEEAIKFAKSRKSDAVDIYAEKLKIYDEFEKQIRELKQKRVESLGECKIEYFSGYDSTCFDEDEIRCLTIKVDGVDFLFEIE